MYTFSMEHSISFDINGMLKVRDTLSYFLCPSEKFIPPLRRLPP